ncbi:acid protease [Punctularia strigosozonata HHB-11173 SS5]|uniref:Acid protease n=1 Tax=Punctularia strigosozonata (strain HHB-11173) TaxID=741275 RepID=R7S4S8_PUNST|nr:acid protease [Punctularia strigosozonata HHB-11173 SS5]EIN04256.1 acid protease [Punctularia strigosozonata HHB-11173 SS5]
MLPLIPLGLVLAVLDVVCAIHVPIHVTRKPGAASPRKRARTLEGRASVAVNDVRDVEYTGNITLGGTAKTVLLDTGSADLWVVGSVPGTKDLGKSATISYAIGSASGDINAASFQFDNFTVDDQAYILVQDASNIGLNDGIQGLMGLGPNSNSVVASKFKNLTGASPLSRIFSQNKTSSNYISLLLTRENNTGDAFTSGQLTISSPVPGYENITSQPKLSVDKVKLSADQHFQVLTDSNGIIGPDGNALDVSSIVPGVHDGKLVAVFDSGFSLPQVPRKVSDAIYGRVQGAKYDTDNEWWTIPCDQYLNISFKFGGVTYPIHPLDLNSDSSDLRAGATNCVGPFQPIGSGAFSIIGDYDMILGMGFLRNTYSLFDFGDFVSTSSNDRSDPFVQLLPITDPSTAKADFVRVRLGGTDTTSSSSKTLLPASQQSHSPLAPGERSAQLKERILSHWYLILIGAIAIVALALGCGVWCCCCRGRRRGGARAVGFRGVSVLPGARGAYKPLHDPATGAMHMAPMGVSGRV